jgi:hypothetical protein
MCRKAPVRFGPGAAGKGPEPQAPRRRPTGVPQFSPDLARRSDVTTWLTCGSWAYADASRRIRGAWRAEGQATRSVWACAAPGISLLRRCWPVTASGVGDPSALAATGCVLRCSLWTGQPGGQAARGCRGEARRLGRGRGRHRPLLCPAGTCRRPSRRRQPTGCRLRGTSRRRPRACPSRARECRLGNGKRVAVQARVMKHRPFLAVSGRGQELLRHARRPRRRDLRLVLADLRKDPVDHRLVVD